MAVNVIPEKLARLHHAEEDLRGEAEVIVAADIRLAQHLHIVEHAMDLADMLRQFPTEDEDLKVIKVLGMRAFNAFGASVKLALSGYAQNSALIMRDILETVFLLDFFNGDRTAISRWRFAEKKERTRDFSPVRIRKSLDTRDGFTEMKRAQMYELFSELAAHPTMKSVYMMRPQKDGDAIIGPFIETTTVEAVLSEMGRLAVQVGEMLDRFFPATWMKGKSARLAFAQAKISWLATFHGTDAGKKR